ncbi:GNAT family N-acetyltransferase [Arthrobacter sp. H5]|uniref:GNAT family N-acetyltransferase n=1 Tax=Arthrobacter sp. H5 TaxID=1267973 RepID=UPI0004B43694|nr:GNAT family N-acetyltransferase [Arthrobacter sp. H5]
MGGFADYAPNVSRQPKAVMTTRKALHHDLRSVLDIERDSGRQANAASLERAISDPHRLVLVAETHEQIIGWAKTHYWDHSDGPAPAGHYLGGLTVAPLWRRQGVAAELTTLRLNWIRQHAGKAWYVVHANNRASIELHQKWGFKEVARAPIFHTLQFTGGVGLLLRADLT